MPNFLFNADKPLQPAKGFLNESIPTLFSVSLANFSFAAEVDIQVDTGSNFLPLTFNSLDGTMYDLGSLRKVGVGHINKTTVPAKKFSTLAMPMNFTYTALNNSDPTCMYQ